MNGREHGVRMGIGGVATGEMKQRQHQAHINRVLGEVYQFHNDPYMITNDMGTIECKLCLTAHRTKESYFLHKESKKHKENLSVKQYHLNKLKERQSGKLQPGMTALGGSSTSVRHTVLKPRVGKPGYSVIKQYHAVEGFHTISFKLECPLIEKGLKPRYRIINTYEQNVEAPDGEFQFIVFAAEPYENIGFKIPNCPIDSSKVLREWDNTTSTFLLQIKFRDEFGSKYRKQLEEKQLVDTNADTNQQVEE
jgi:splicing factor 3A subunit 2